MNFLFQTVGAEITTTSASPSSCSTPSLSLSWTKSRYNQEAFCQENFADLVDADSGFTDFNFTIS